MGKISITARLRLQVRFACAIITPEQTAGLTDYETQGTREYVLPRVGVRSEPIAEGADISQQGGDEKSQASKAQGARRARHKEGR